MDKTTSYEYIPKYDHKENEKYMDTVKKKDEKVQELICGLIFVVSTFFTHLLTTGFSYSLGVYYLVFLEVFGQSNGVTSWVGSLNVACLLAAGPLASCLLTRYGCSTTLMLGGLLGGIGLVLTAFAQSIYVVLAAYGVVAGIGFGLVFTTNVTVITMQFDKWRKLAMGISMSGIGCGTFVYPFVNTLLIEAYGWRGAMLITAAVTFNVCVLALLVHVATAVSDVEENNRKRKEKLEQKRICADEKIMEKCSTNGGIKAVPTSDVFQLNVDKSIESGMIESMIDVPNEEKEPNMCSIGYFILHVNNFLFCFGQSVIYTHIFAFAFTHGVPSHICSSFISIVGISSIFGRILLGMISQHPLINITVLYSVCYAMSGLCSFGYSFWTHPITMMIFLSVLGFCFGAYGPLLSELVLVTVGINNFAHAFGFLMLTNGAGTLLGAPCAGWLYDVTDVYAYSFYLGGSSLILSALVMGVPRLARVRHDTY